MKIPTARRCATWDCDRPSRPNGLFCSDACRARTWRKNHPEYQPPPGQSRRQNAAERRSPGGLQVSVGRLLEVLQGPTCGYLTEKAARAAISEALSERQRARFEGPKVLPGQLEMGAA